MLNFFLNSTGSKNGVLLLIAYLNFADLDFGLMLISLEDGVIILMIYGKYQRYALNQVKKVFNAINLEQNKDSIMTSKKIINNLNPKHPANIFSISKDINYDSGVIDLLLHKQEKFYSIEEILLLLF